MLKSVLVIGVHSIRTAALVIILLFTLPLVAKKPREWQQGMLKDVSSESNSRLVGVYDHGQGALVQRRNDATFYTVDAGEYVYVAERKLTRRGDMQLSVTVNDPVRFAIEGADFYMQDEQGKEHKLTLEKKTRKIVPAK